MGNELTPKQRGNISEIESALALMRFGCKISFPYGEDSPYDFIVDFCGKLFRFQNKISRKKDGYIEFSTRHNNKKYEKGSVDFFSTNCDGEVYIVPSRICSTAKYLRTEIPKNGQTEGISFAKDFTVEKFIEYIKRLS